MVYSLIIVFTKSHFWHWTENRTNKTTCRVIVFMFQACDLNLFYVLKTQQDGLSWSWTNNPLLPKPSPNELSYCWKTTLIGINQCGPRWATVSNGMCYLWVPFIHSVPQQRWIHTNMLCLLHSCWSSLVLIWFNCWVSECSTLRTCLETWPYWSNTTKTWIL